MLWWDPSKVNKFSGGTKINVMVGQLWCINIGGIVGPSRCYDGPKVGAMVGSNRCLVVVGLNRCSGGPKLDVMV